MSSMFARLDFNVIQMRLASDKGFTVRLPSLHRLAYSMLQDPGTIDLYTRQDLLKLIRRTSSVGIELIPELSFKTNAASWYGTGHLAKCPNVLCRGGSVPQDLTHPDVLPIVFTILSELRSIFPSDLIHLGHDDREGSQPCFDEAGVNTTGLYDHFERKMSSLFEFAEIPETNLIRYQDSELRPGEDRVGQIRHYPATTPVSEIQPSGGPFFVTVDILDGSLFQVYERTRKLAALRPRGILAELRHLYTYQWRDYHMAPRLMAFSLATTHGRLISAQNVYNETDFEIKYHRFCRSNNFADVNCTIPPKEYVLDSVEDISETQDWTDAHCELRTKTWDLNQAKHKIPPFYNESMKRALLQR